MRVRGEFDVWLSAAIVSRKNSVRPFAMEFSARLITQKKHRVPFNNAPVPLFFVIVVRMVRSSHRICCCHQIIRFTVYSFSQIEILARKDFLLFISFHSRLDVRRQLHIHVARATICEISRSFPIVWRSDDENVFTTTLPRFPFLFYFLHLRFGFSSRKTLRWTRRRIFMCMARMWARDDGPSREFLLFTPSKSSGSNKIIYFMYALDRNASREKCECCVSAHYMLVGERWMPVVAYGFCCK